MPFGLKNATQSFQCFIDQVFSGLHFSYTYIDDVLVASSTPESTSNTYVQMVLECLKQYGVVIRLSKYVLSANAQQFPGHQVNREGVQPLEEKVIAILDFPLPLTRKKPVSFRPGKLLPLVCEELCSNCAAT